MSLLDTLKNIFCGKNQQDTSVTEKVEDVIDEIKEKTEEVVEDIKETVEEVVDTIEEKFEEVTSAVKAKVSPPIKEDKAIQLPEDSALRRHAISALKIEIESSMPDRPTDSALRRHYDSAVQAKLAELID